MQAFLLYNLKAAVLIAVLFMFYRLMLSKETMHRLNRAVILLIPVLGYLIPAGWITFTKEVTVPLADYPVSALPMADGLASQAEADPGGGILLTRILLAVYLAGALIVALKTVLTVLSIRSLIRKGEIHEGPSGISIVVLDGDIFPMSWMKTIILSREDYLHETSIPEGESGILLHECAHIRMHHSVDILYLSILLVFQWFNPAMWMMRSDLRDVHEFLSDESVIKSGIDPKQYQFMLVRKAMAEVGYTLANSFSHSTLTKRINMMLKTVEVY